MFETLFRARWRAPAILLAALPATAVGQTAQGTISYPPAFFAAQRPANAYEMLDRIPGFVLDDGSGVRGFEGSGGNVLVDGQRPVTKSEGLEAVLERIPAGKVAHIDVIRGGAPGIDMQGRAVVANVVQKTGEALRGQLEGHWSHLPDGRETGDASYQVSGGSGGRAWESSGTWGKGFSGLLGDGAGLATMPTGPDVATRIRTEDDGRVGQVTGAYETPLAGGRLRVNGLTYHDDLKFEEEDVPVPAGVTASTTQLTRDNSRELGLSFNRDLPAASHLQLVGLRKTYGLDQSVAYADGGGDQLFAIDRTNRETIGRAVLKHSQGPDLTLEAGAETALNTLASVTRFAVDGAPAPVPAADVQVRERRTELFVKAGWRLSPRWSLDGQLRDERSNISARGDVALHKSLAFLKPRLLVTWSASADLQVRLRGEREVGQLDFDSFVAQGDLKSATGVTAGNPDLEPERAWVAEAAVEQRFWDRGAFIVTATHAEVRGVVDRGPVFSPAGVFDRPANIGDGSRDSLKAELTLPLARFGLPRAQLKGFVVRRWSQVADPTTGLSRPISAGKPVEWEAHFTQDVPARNLNWGVSVYGGWQQVYYRFNAVDAYKLDPFVMTFVEWRPRRDVQVRAELENITERGYRHTTVTYAGVRDAARTGPAALSDRNFHFGRIFYLRVRKTFGG